MVILKLIMTTEFDYEDDEDPAGAYYPDDFYGGRGSTTSITLFSGYSCVATDVNDFALPLINVLQVGMYNSIVKKNLR